MSDEPGANRTVPLSFAGKTVTLRCTAAPHQILLSLIVKKYLFY
jgi:hypothetical protein